MEKITQLQADLKAGKITQAEYLSKLQALLAAGDIEQSEFDGAKGFEVKADDKSFTQAELDEIVAKRLARDRKGREDYDDIKTQLTTLQTAEEERKKAAMTELERIEAEKADALKRAQEAEEARAKALGTANERLIKASFTIAAQKANIEYVDDAYKLADMSGVSVDDEGNIIGVDDAVKALVESKPFLAAKAPVQPRIIGGPTDQLPRGEKTKEQLLKEAEDKARTSGRLEDSAAYAKLKRELAD